MQHIDKFNIAGQESLVVPGELKQGEVVQIEGIDYTIESIEPLDNVDPATLPESESSYSASR